MRITLQSKIKDAWRHPCGRNMLCLMLRKTGRKEAWIERGMIANMPLRALNRMISEGFAEMIVEVCAQSEWQNASYMDEIGNEQKDEAVSRMSGEQAYHSIDATDTSHEDERAWWKEGVIYQVFLPSFMDSNHDGIGDVGGVVRRLPYLEKLGVDALWLWQILDSDICKNSGVRSYEQPSKDVGNAQEVKRLIRRAHERGMRVMMGLDIAATSDEHPWFADAMNRGKEGYYILKKGTAAFPPNNWGHSGGISMWTWCEGACAWALHVEGRHQMDLDWDNEKLREKMAQVLNFWVDMGVDGFYLGYVDTLSKRDYGNASPAGEVLGVCGYEKFVYGPNLRRYLGQLRRAIKGKRPLLCAGVHNIQPEIAKQLCAPHGGGVDMLFERGITAGWQSRKIWPSSFSLSEMKQAYIRRVQNHDDDCHLPLAMEAACTPRMLSRLNISPVYQKVAAKLLATMLLSLRGTPVIYQGQELGLFSLHGGGAVSKDAKPTVHADTPTQEQASCAFYLMPWNSGAHAGFSGAQPWIRPLKSTQYLNAAMQMEDTSSVWHHYYNLISLRKKNSCLVQGSFQPVFERNKKLFCYFRILGSQKWYIEINLTESQVPRPIRILPTQKLMQSNYDMQSPSLRPYEANMYRCE